MKAKMFLEHRGHFLPMHHKETLNKFAAGSSPPAAAITDRYTSSALRHQPKLSKPGLELGNGTPGQDG